MVDFGENNIIKKPHENVVDFDFGPLPHPFVHFLTIPCSSFITPNR